jgi:alcohol-forming fatty acyl-CoA reductase
MAGEEGAPGLRLAGKSVLLTGVTGFLGQAVLERILVDLPETRPVLLVRPRGTTPARARVERLLTGSAFGALREREGPEGMRRILEERVEVLEGDVAGTLPPLPQDLDVVIHAAASVSFDPPIDEAFSSNVLGPAALYEAARALPSRPHLIHVSTAYVAGVPWTTPPASPRCWTGSWPRPGAATPGPGPRRWPTTPNGAVGSGWPSG